MLTVASLICITWNAQSTVCNFWACMSVLYAQNPSASETTRQIWMKTRFCLLLIHEEMYSEQNVSLNLSFLKWGKWNLIWGPLVCPIRFSSSALIVVKRWDHIRERWWVQTPSWFMIGASCSFSLMVQGNLNSERPIRKLDEFLYPHQIRIISVLSDCRRNIPTQPFSFQRCENEI